MLSLPLIRTNQHDPQSGTIFGQMFGTGAPQHPSTHNSYVINSRHFRNDGVKMSYERGMSWSALIEFMFFKLTKLEQPQNWDQNTSCHCHVLAQIVLLQKSSYCLDAKWKEVSRLICSFFQIISVLYLVRFWVNATECDRNHGFKGTMDLFLCMGGINVRTLHE